MALTVVEQVVTALRVAHRRGLVHQDVKPENVLVSHEGAVKVADFGLVAAAWDADGAEDPADDGGMLLGTVAYLSPEQVADGHADARSDLYAAGIVLFELLTGAPPYDGDTPGRIASRHVAEDVPPPSARVGGIPRALDRLVMAMTRRDPDERPADADEFLADAREVRVRAHLPVLPVPPPATRTAIPASARPMRGTRLLDLRADAPDPDDADPDLEDDLDDEDSDDLDEPGRRDRRKDSGRVDDLDVAIGHLERRRARTRSRRLLAAWVLLVVLASLAASAAGWSLGAGLLVGS
jgi:serine/threonine-protein kinase